MERTATTDSFPWPWRDADTRRVTWMAVAWIAAINLWALVAIDFLPIPRRAPWEPAAAQRAPLFARYDSGWYDSIVRFGYQAPPPPGMESAHAFFPLYPELARFLHLATGLDSFQSALVVTYAALLFALPLFLGEARRRLGEVRAWDGLWFLLLFPVGFFLAACYTESLYLLLVLLAFRAVRKDQPGLAVLFGVLSGLTRAPAAAVGPALAIAWVLTHAGRRRWWGLAVGAAPVLGVAGWIVGIGLAKGEPGLFFRSMGAWRHSLASTPLSGPSSFAGELYDQVREGYFFVHPGALLPWLHFLVFSAIAGVQLRMQRYSDAAWTLGVLGLSVVTGTSAGIPRYTLTIFPAVLLLPELLASRPRARVAFLGVSASLLLLHAAFFTCWHFVS